MIKVSVIIPNYNHAVFLKERIESVLKQSYPNFELIILDDHSTDNSRDIIEQYRQHPKVSHIIYNKTNSGFPSRQWQKGVQVVKGDWIWIAESDDIAKPLFLERLVNYIQQYPTAGIVYSNSYKEDADAAGFKTTAEETNSDFSTTSWNDSHLMDGKTAINHYLSKKNIILNISSALIRNECLGKSLQEMKAIRYYADWYLYICIAGIADIAYCHQLLNTFRRHSGSLIQRSGIRGIKIDYFRILNLLSKQAHISNKAGLINYFADTYIKPGLKKEGKISFIKLMTRYFLVNPGLAMKVARRIFTKAKNR